MSYYFKRSQFGFTLAEMLVSLGIVTAMLTVVIFNQQKYTDGVALSNLADEISLRLFEAQAYGSGVRELSIGSGEFDISYGYSFSLEDSTTDYIFFADLDADQQYDGDWTCATGPGLECLEKVSISNGNIIEEVCVLRSAGGDICNPERVDINFIRPKTEAKLTFYSTGGGIFAPANIIGAEIKLESPKGAMRSVIVYTSGQISAN